MVKKIDGMVRKIISSHLNGSNLQNSQVLAVTVLYGFCLHSDFYYERTEKAF